MEKISYEMMSVQIGEEIENIPVSFSYYGLLLFTRYSGISLEQFSDPEQIEDKMKNMDVMIQLARAGINNGHRLYAKDHKIKKNTELSEGDVCDLIDYDPSVMEQIAKILTKQRAPAEEDDEKEPPAGNAKEAASPSRSTVSSS